MKASAVFGLAVVMLSTTSISLLAQSESRTEPSMKYTEQTELVGTKITVQGEEVGHIKGVVLDSRGDIVYTVVEITDVTDRGKTVAVPASVYSPASDRRVRALRVAKDRLYSAPVFEYGHVDKYSSDWVNKVYSHFGVSPASLGAAKSTAAQGTATDTGRAAKPATPRVESSPERAGRGSERSYDYGAREKTLLNPTSAPESMHERAGRESRASSESPHEPGGRESKAEPSPP